MQRLNFKRMRWGVTLTLLLVMVAASSATGLVTGVEHAAAQMQIGRAHDCTPVTL